MNRASRFLWRRRIYKKFGDTSRSGSNRGDFHRDRYTEEDVVGGGEFTTVEEGEGVGSTGRKMMPVGFYFLRASFGTSESSSSESDSESLIGISVGGGGTS